LPKALETQAFSALTVIYGHCDVAWLQH